MAILRAALKAMAETDRDKPCPVSVEPRKGRGSKPRCCVVKSDFREGKPDGRAAARIFGPKREGA